MRPLMRLTLGLLTLIAGPHLALATNFDFQGLFEPHAAGNASVTHYDIPKGFVTSCGCAVPAANFPTVAVNTAAYGSATGSGPACGYCFNISLIEAIEATPPFILSSAARPWVVVKITDQCPAPANTAPDKTWCGATPSQANMADSFVHFDMSSPSPGIPASFFPSNVSLYGYSDFGAWRASYAAVSCDSWEGISHPSAVGRDPSVSADAGCCPVDPLTTGNATCPVATASTSDGSRNLVFHTLLKQVSLDVILWSSLWLIVKLSFA